MPICVSQREDEPNLAERGEEPLGEGTGVGADSEVGVGNFLGGFSNAERGFVESTKPN